MSETPFFRFPNRFFGSTCSKFLNRSLNSLEKCGGYSSLNDFIVCCMTELIVSPIAYLFGKNFPIDRNGVLGIPQGVGIKRGIRLVSSGHLKIYLKTLE